MDQHREEILQRDGDGPSALLNEVVFGVEDEAEKDWEWLVEELTEIDHDLTSDIAQMEPDWDEWAAETKEERSRKHHWFFVFET